MSSTIVPSAEESHSATTTDVVEQIPDEVARQTSVDIEELDGLEYKAHRFDLSSTVSELECGLHTAHIQTGETSEPQEISLRTALKTVVDTLETKFERWAALSAVSLDAVWCDLFFDVFEDRPIPDEKNTHMEIIAGALVLFMDDVLAAAFEERKARQEEAMKDVKRTVLDAIYNHEVPREEIAGVMEDLLEAVEEREDNQ